LKNQKKLNEVSKPLHLSTNPEILMKIALLVSELRGLESRPLKKINKKNIEKTSVKYIALPATLPSGLNKNESPKEFGKRPRSHPSQRQINSAVDQPFCHDGLDRQTNRWLEGMFDDYGPLLLYGEFRSLIIITRSI